MGIRQSAGFVPSPVRSLSQCGDNWTDTTVDGLGRTVEVKEQQSSLTTAYEYSAADDLTEVTAPDNLVTTITYDRAGRKLTTDDPDSGSWSYTYDANSNLKTQNDPSGDVTTLLYDNLNRPTEKQVDGLLIGRWYCDPANNLGLLWDQRHYRPRNAAGNDIGTTYQRMIFDEWGRKTQDQTFVSQPEGNSQNMFRFRTVYTLRDDDQVATVHHPSDDWYGYTHKLDYTYNTRTGAAETLAEQSGSGGLTIVSDVDWNQAGQVTEMQFGTAAGDPISRWYYDANTLRMYLDTFGTNNWITRDRYNVYTQDGNGNITKLRELRNAEQHQCFSYDKLDRLLTAYTDTSACNGHSAVGAGNYDHTYTYSPGGNITSKTGTGAGTHSGTYTYGNTDHAHAVTATSDGSTFAYNVDGDMVTRNLAGQPAQSLAWNDDHRRLAKVTEGANVVAEFIYGLDDTRLRRKTGDTYTYYHVDGTEYVWDNSTNTGVFTYYHQMSGRTVAFTKSDTGVTTWMHADQVNSTSVTRDQTGTASTQRYTPWGELRTDGNLGTDHHFTGQVADQSTGLAFYNARYYDPVIGRFVSPDTIVPYALDGQSYNRYSYVENEPTRRRDPSGQCSVDLDGYLTCGRNSFNYGCATQQCLSEQGESGLAELSRQRVNHCMSRTADCGKAQLGIASVGYVATHGDRFDNGRNRGGLDGNISPADFHSIMRNAHFDASPLERWVAAQVILTGNEDAFYFDPSFFESLATGVTPVLTIVGGVSAFICAGSLGSAAAACVVAVASAGASVALNLLAANDCAIRDGRNCGSYLTSAGLSALGIAAGTINPLTGFVAAGVDSAVTFGPQAPLDYREAWM